MIEWDHLAVYIGVVFVCLFIAYLAYNRKAAKERDLVLRQLSSTDVHDARELQWAADHALGTVMAAGKFDTEKPVRLPEFGPNARRLLAVTAVDEEYRPHQVMKSYTDASGNTRTRMVTEWSWDRVGSDCRSCIPVVYGVSLPPSVLDGAEGFENLDPRELDVDEQGGLFSYPRVDGRYWYSSRHRRRSYRGLRAGVTGVCVIDVGESNGTVLYSSTVHPLRVRWSTVEEYREHLQSGKLDATGWFRSVLIVILVTAVVIALLLSFFFDGVFLDRSLLMMWL